MASAEAVKKWRELTKQRIVDAFGGSCGLCGYDKYLGSLKFHHLDPTTKSFEINDALVNPRAWNKLVVELRKCVCICGNCHDEVHAGIVIIPLDIKRFDESFASYRIFKKDEFDICPVCGGEKWKYSVTCSYQCAAKKSGRIEWDKINLKDLIAKYSYCEIGKQLGVSDCAIRKRVKKLEL